MPDYVASALFVYTEEGAAYIEPLQQNSLGVTITAVAYETLQQNPADSFRDIDHVVVCGPLESHKEIARYAMEHDFSLGFIKLLLQLMISLDRIRMTTLPITDIATKLPYFTTELLNLGLQLRNEGQQSQILNGRRF